MLGLIGLGLMGGAFAGRLIRAGYEVLDLDIDPGRNAARRPAGA